MVIKIFDLESQSPVGLAPLTTNFEVKSDKEFMLLVCYLEQEIPASY
jgi:hypothetical protein